MERTRAVEEILEEIRYGITVFNSLTWDGLPRVANHIKESMKQAPPLEIHDVLRVFASRESASGASATENTLSGEIGADEYSSMGRDGFTHTEYLGIDLKGLVFPVHLSSQENDLNCLLFFMKEGVLPLQHTKPILELTEGENWDRIVEAFAIRNEKIGIEVDLRNPSTTIRDILDAYRAKIQPDTIPSTEVDQIRLSTSQETVALHDAMADGKRGNNWLKNPQDHAWMHHKPNKTHRVEFGLTIQELNEGLTEEYLKPFLAGMDADGILVVSYALTALTPLGVIPDNTTPVALLDLNDIARKTGFDPRSAQESEAVRSQIYSYLQFVARAKVIGNRTIPYVDKKTREVISTRIESVLWSIQTVQRPLQLGLMPYEEVPVQVELALARPWIPLLTDPNLQQWLIGGEMLGKIPNRQLSGAWARTIGISLSSHWRIDPKHRKIPTRSQLLELAPSSKSAKEILASSNPQRAQQAFDGAIEHLTQIGFLQRTNPVIKAKKERKELPRKGWQSQWLGEPVDLLPSKIIEDSLASIASHIYEGKNQSLRVKGKK